MSNFVAWIKCLELGDSRRLGISAIFTLLEELDFLLNRNFPPYRFILGQKYGDFDNWDCGPFSIQDAGNLDRATFDATETSAQIPALLTESGH